MDRPTRWKARLASAIVAALVMVPAPAAQASAVPAGEEYVLQLPGVPQSNSTVNSQPTGGSVASGGIQRGVVGESAEPAGPLAALGDALAAIPAAIVAGIAALLVLALLAIPLRHLTPHGSR